MTPSPVTERLAPAGGAGSPDIQENGGGAVGPPPKRGRLVDYLSAGQTAEISPAALQQPPVDRFVCPTTPLESPPKLRTPVLLATAGCDA